MNSFLKTIEKGSKSIQNFVPLHHSDKEKDKDKDKEKDKDNKSSRPSSLANSAHSFPSAPSSPVLSSPHLLPNLPPVHPSFSTNSITSSISANDLSDDGSNSDSKGRRIVIAERTRSKLQLCASPHIELITDTEVLLGFKCCVVDKWYACMRVWLALSMLWYRCGGCSVSCERE